MDRPHILLISLETLRRDHLGCYGCTRELMPNLDRLADEGARCRDSVANCGWTLPQHMTLHTGLYPLTHSVVLWDGPPIGKRWTMLAEHLKAHGYRTFAGVSERNNFGGGAIFGFDRGFDEHAPGAAYNRHMPWTEEFIVSRLRDHHAAGPCFVYVHVNDSHEPFDPPEPWHSMWGTTYHNKYEGELSYVDHYLGRIFASLKELGILDETLVVVFADHGTTFWEHEFLEKKCNLYREILDVPLLVRYPPRIPPGRVVEGLVESAMVLPTILELAGLPPLPQAQAPSFVPRLLGTSSDAPEYVCAHTAHNDDEKHGPIQFEMFAIQSLDLKFIRTEVRVEPDVLYGDRARHFRTIMLRAGYDPCDLEKGTVIRELYDFRVDPGEHRTLVSPIGQYFYPPVPDRFTPDEARAVAADLEAKLDAWIADTRRAGEQAG
jgi:arylsulfatase A-like enzyme